MEPTSPLPSPLPDETRGAHDTPSTRPLGASGLVEFDHLGDRAEHSSSFRLTNFQQSGPASVGRLGSGGLHLSRPIEWRDGNLPPRDARLSAGGDVVRTTLLSAQRQTRAPQRLHPSGALAFARPPKAFPD